MGDVRVGMQQQQRGSYATGTRQYHRWQLQHSKTIDFRSLLFLVIFGDWVGFLRRSGAGTWACRNV